MILCAALIFAVCSASFGSFADETGYRYEHTRDWDEDCKTSCGGDCGTSPVIVVPGIMQSQVYVQDENGNDLMTSEKTEANDYRGYPIVEGMDLAFMFDTNEIQNQFKEKMPTILKDVALRDREALLDTVIGIVDKGCESHYFNDDGTRVNDVKVDEYWYSLEAAKSMPEKSYGYAKGYEKDENGNVKPTYKYENECEFIVKQVDITSFCDKYGYDHTYYFSYASFGNIFESAKLLKEYVQMVKCQTGHDKVSIVFISLGGTIGNVFLSKYADPDELDKVVFAAAALDGSYLLADLMDANSTLTDTECIYNDLIPNIVSIAAKEYMALGYLGNTLARAIPEELFTDFLEEALTKGINGTLAKIMRGCQSMWALVPSGVYPELRDKYLTGISRISFREMTDEYYQIQLKAADNIRKLQADGVTVFLVCGYDLQFPALVDHYKLSSDVIIQSESTSCGGTFAEAGKTLGKDYVPTIDDSYISPDGAVDAGTCALPDHTFFVKGQSHLMLPSAINDVIGLCVELLGNDEITDARVHNGGYPQFNEYRDLRKIERLIKAYEEADLDGLSAAKRSSLDSAYSEAKELLAKKEWSAKEAVKVEEKFAKAAKKAGILPGDFKNPVLTYDVMPVLEKIFRFASEVFRFIFGGRDFWPFPVKLI